MKKHVKPVGSYHRSLIRIGSFLLCSLGISAARPSWGQAPTPSIPPVQEAPAPLPDPFYNALESLSKKYSIAFVAEGRPFPSGKNGLLPMPHSGQEADTDPIPGEDQPPKAETAGPADPASHKDLSPEETAVQKVAGKFDYDVVHQGKVYLLTKRYINPDDMPEVTPEECRVALRLLEASPGNRSGVQYEQGILDTVNEELRNGAANRDQDPFRGLKGPVPDFRQNLHLLANCFYFQSHSERIQGIRSILESGHPFDPVFHWRTLGQTPVFGYDMQFRVDSDPLFLPASDCDRVVVAPYGTPFPRSGWWMRTDTLLPDTDPTDPAGLSDQTKRFLDDNGRSSRAITISEALAALNKRVPKKTGSKVYKAEAAYAGKRVTLVGADNLPPEDLMQALAAVYGLGVSLNRDDTVVLTRAPGYQPPPRVMAFTMFREYDKYVRPYFPSPIYRVMHARFLAGRSKAKNTEGAQILQYETQYEYQRLAAGFRNSAMRMLRYLVEPQVKAQAKAKLPLSRLGEREHTLFTLAETASGFADACEVVDIPVPPYVTHIDDSRANIRITGGIYPKGASPLGPYLYDNAYFSRITMIGGHLRSPDDSARLALFVTYVDPNSGVAYGPIPLLDMPLNY